MKLKIISLKFFGKKVHLLEQQQYNPDPYMLANMCRIFTLIFTSVFTIYKDWQVYFPALLYMK